MGEDAPRAREAGGSSRRAAQGGGLTSAGAENQLAGGVSGATSGAAGGASAAPSCSCSFFFGRGRRPLPPASLSSPGYFDALAFSQSSPFPLRLSQKISPACSANTGFSRAFSGTRKPEAVSAPRSSSTVLLRSAARRSTGAATLPVLVSFSRSLTAANTLPG